MSTYEDLAARRTAARNALVGHRPTAIATTGDAATCAVVEFASDKPSPDPALGQHNIPNVAVALDALQSLVEFHGGLTDAAALQAVRDALTPSPHREPRIIPAVVTRSI